MVDYLKKTWISDLVTLTSSIAFLSSNGVHVGGGSSNMASQNCIVCLFKCRKGVGCLTLKFEPKRTEMNEVLLL